MNNEEARVCIRSTSHRYFLYVRGGDVARLPGAAARREPPVRATALEDEERLARGEAQRVPLRRAEGEQRAIHHPTLTRPSRVNGALGEQKKRNHNIFRSCELVATR